MKHATLTQPWMGFAHYEYMMFALPIALRAKVIVETGLSRGGSTRIFLEAARLVNAHVYTIDYVDYPDTVKLLTEMGLTANWTFIHADLAKYKWTGPPIDFLFLDSDHHIDHVYRELETFTPHLTANAVIGTDDTAPSEIRDPDCLVYKAFEQWVDAHPEWNCVQLTEPRGEALMWRS